MEIKEYQIKGVYEITLSPFVDERGFFMRTYDHELFIKSGLPFQWMQENHSRTEKKGTIRGLHFQLPPYSEAKLIRCIRGKILDIFVDLRDQSPTFGKWGSIELSEENKKEILIPRGLAHGFYTLTEICEVVYKVDNVYSKEFESGLIWNDPDLNITWPINEKPILSEKDAQNMSFREFKKKNKSIIV